MDHGRLIISSRLTTAEIAGSAGTHGMRKGRGRSGRVRRRTMTAIDTMTNAISVPMLTRWPSVPIGVRPAAMATTTPVTIVETWGVWRFVSCG